MENLLTRSSGLTGLMFIYNTRLLHDLCVKRVLHIKCYQKYTKQILQIKLLNVRCIMRYIVHVTSSYFKVKIPKFIL